MIAQFKSSLKGFTDKSLFISIEKKWSRDYQLLCRKKFKDKAVRVVKHIVAYLYKEYGKEVLLVFTAYFQKEAKICFWNLNNYSHYSEEKAAQDIIDEQLFTWLE